MRFRAALRAVDIGKVFSRVTNDTLDFFKVLILLQIQLERGLDQVRFSCQHNEIICATDSLDTLNALLRILHTL